MVVEGIRAPPPFQPAFNEHCFRSNVAMALLIVSISLKITTHPFEFLNKRRDFLENALFFGQILRV